MDINQEARKLCDRGHCCSMAEARRLLMSKPDLKNMVVWHGTHFDEYFFHKTLNKGYYTIVANVLCSSLDEAYQATNNIDVSWDENAHVNAVPLPKDASPDTTCLYRRSTSIGDLIEVDGKFHVVEFFGFRELTPEEVCAVTFFSPLR